MGGFNAFAGGMAILSALFMALTLTFFGAICFVADDMRRHLKQLAENSSAGRAAPPPAGSDAS